MSFLDDLQNTIKQNGLVADPSAANSHTQNTASVNLANQIIALQTQTSSMVSSLMGRGLSLSWVNQSSWNQVYPYSIMILRLDGGSYIIHQGLQATLPITPQELNVSTPFASTLTVTSRGISDESNGAPIRNISFSASTGVFIKRPSFATTSPDHSFIGTVFAGTISAVNNVGSTFSALAGSNISAQSGNTLSADLATTGYYQYHIIRSILELYAEMKKRPDGQQFRLAIQLAKDNITYLVTPQMFSLRKSAASPLEYIYSFQGIAWGTVPQNQIQQGAASSGPSAGSKALVNSIGDTQAALSALRNVRGLIQSVQAVVTAVKTDIDVNVIGPINNVILALKTAMSIPATIADLPSQIQQSFQQNVINQAANLTSQIPSNMRASFTAAVAITLANQPTTPQNSFSIDVATNTSVLNDINFTDNISVDSLQLNTAQQNAVSNATLSALSIDNNYVNNLVGQIQGTVAVLDPVAEDQGNDSPLWPILYGLQETQTSLYGLISSNIFGVTSTADTQSGITPLIEFYQATTAAENINFVLPQSKMAIPFPFRITLERLAQQYLGDATRWIEIVAVNDLKPPYIDEDGFVNNFLSNGNGNQFNVSNNTNLFNNQIILIGSDTIPLQSRKIITIQQLSDTNFLITVDGDPTLGDFLLSEGAYMRGYLPNTVNSQKMIYIPLASPTNVDNTITKPLPFIDADPQLVKLSKIDLLLDQSGDLAVTNDGFFNLAYGAANFIQAAKLKLTAAAGSIILNPDYGGAPEVGDSIADVTVQDVTDAIVTTFVSDERFNGITNITVTENEDAMAINLVVPVAQTGTDLPLSFNLPQ